LSSPVRWVRSFPPPGCTRHASLYVAGQLREMGWPVEAEPLRLDPLPDAAREVDAWLTGRGLAGSAMRPLLIHVGSGGKRKIWPLSKWWGFLEQVRREFSVPLVLTLGPADERLVEFASEARARFGAHVVSNAPLTWVAALAAASAAYVGSDSGISHLAASMGARSVVIFGPTAPQVWAPRGRCVHIVQSAWEEEDVFAWSPDVARSPIDAPVYEAVAALLRA
ncbi:MAG: glycosyltransferase family 9 protein, partial [Syntrophobacteraceae bacterium]